MTSEPILGGIGLTASKFLEALTDHDLRRLIDPNTLSILDGVFGDRLEGEALTNAAKAIVDLGSMLNDKDRRSLVMELLPESKQVELEGRLERTISSAVTEWQHRDSQVAREFFGINEETLPPTPIPSMRKINPGYGLFDHQQKAVNDLMPLLLRDDRRAVLHLPTGVGKTRTAMHVVCKFLQDYNPAIVVWLSSGRELLDQATSAFSEAWTHLGSRSIGLATMWGDRTPELDDFSDGFLGVSLAKAWAIKTRTDEDWITRLSSNIRLVIFDEAHQSIAKTYRQVTDELTLSYQCSLLGLTATPGRTWSDIDHDGELAEFYGGNKVGLEVPGDDPIEYLIENEYLARPHFRTLLTEPGLNLTGKEQARIANAMDIPNDLVESMTMQEQYMMAILTAVDQLLDSGHHRVIVYAGSVKHADTLAAILSARSILSASVTSGTPERLRNRSIKAFVAESDTPMVLVNYGILTTGFDAPMVSAIVIARPTQSLVLYSQMVGRGLRGPKAGGTKQCEIITVLDPSIPGFGNVTEAFLNWEDVWK